MKFRDPQVKPRLQKIIERSPKFSELLSSDRIADALIQGNLLRGIDILSTAAYTKLNSPFDDCFVGSDFDPYRISNTYSKMQTAIDVRPHQK